MVGKISKINNRVVHQSNSRKEAKLSLYLHIDTNTKLQIHGDKYVEKHKQIQTLIDNLKETLRDTITQAWEPTNRHTHSGNKTEKGRHSYHNSSTLAIYNFTMMDLSQNRIANSGFSQFQTTAYTISYFDSQLDYNEGSKE